MKEDGQPSPEISFLDPQTRANWTVSQIPAQSPFFKDATIVALTSPWARCGVSGICRAAQSKRIAFGGMQIECSTYSRIRARMEDFTVQRGQELADDPFFSALKTYPYPFLPTLLATAVPGGPVERATYEELKAEFLHRISALL